MKVKDFLQKFRSANPNWEVFIEIEGEACSIVDVKYIIPEVVEEDGGEKTTYTCVNRRKAKAIIIE